MAFDPTTVKKTAHQARLEISEQDIPDYYRNLSNILDLVAQMEIADTSGIEPMAHPMDTAQRLRVDVVTEQDQREHFQAIAPEVVAGLYLVPKVIAEE